MIFDESFVKARLAKAAATSDHEHRWEHRPHQSGSVSRYQCSICRRWGSRVWPCRGGKVQPIIAYVSKDTEPKTEWGGEDWPQMPIRESPARSYRFGEDCDDPAVCTPPYRWRNTP